VTTRALFSATLARCTLALTVALLTSSIACALLAVGLLGLLPSMGYGGFALAAVLVVCTWISGVTYMARLLYRSPDFMVKADQSAAPNKSPERSHDQ
jgi:hypothetical protein